ncbi:MAG: hypothetical protein FE78DRAFT_72396 [Acidomyces sp. 'richmondensis']|nr:MAG: hypothetical protein FE78DRAFT_72396 [Acidomyces sp. 'richmondensis']
MCVESTLVFSWIWKSGSPVAFGGSAYFTVGVAGMISSMWRMHGDDSWSRHGAAHGDGREKWHDVGYRSPLQIRAVLPMEIRSPCASPPTPDEFSRADKTCSDVHVQGSSGWEEESNESGVAMMEKDLGSEVIHLSSGEDVYLARARDLAKNADGSRSLSSLEADDRPSAVNGQGGDSPQYVNESPGWPKAVGLLRRRLRALDRVRFLRDVTPTWVRTGSRAVACRDEWMWRARRRRVRIDGKFEKSSEAHTDDATRGSPSSQPVRIGSSTTNSRHVSNTATHEFSSCALRKRSFEMPSAYVSDEDLFGDDDVPYLSEPPPPPRPAAAYLAQPLLPPVVPPRRRSVVLKPSGRSSKVKS